MATSDAIRADHALSLKTSSSDLSQSTYPDMVDVDTTPPTSSSGLSSKDIIPHIGESHATTKPLGAAPMGIHTQRIPPPPLASRGVNNGVVPRSRSNSPSKNGSENVLVQGQKRTASGEVKENNTAGLRNLKMSGIGGHSRTTSTASNGNRIAELSSQLRARLSYAASVVEKNWQSRDINGMERAITRHSESPARSRTSSHDLGQIYFSPGNEAAKTQMHHLNGSPEKVPEYVSDSTSPRKSRPVNGPARISSSTAADMISLTRSSTQPENKGPFPGELPNLNKNQRRTLAPPADIVTGENKARRRPNPNANAATPKPNPSPGRQPQNTQQGRYQPLSHNRTNSMNSIVPGTPPPFNSQPSSNLQYSTPTAISSKGRTPSQNAIMEQDAIETLLFMSSPGNSGYHPSNSSQNSQPQQPQQQLKREQHISLNQAISSSSMAPPKSTLDSQVGLGIDGAPGLDSHKTPTQAQPQTQRPARRVSFLDSNYSDSNPGTNHSDLDFQPEHGIFQFEDQAGDEIDRLLDQMVEEDSDSDDNFIRNSQAWLQGGKGGVSNTTTTATNGSSQ